ncbi:hypothetical protein ACN469_20105 [Corallococcus terminator]
MANTAARLSVLAFPQFWDGTQIGLRVLVLPKGNPRESLLPGTPAFADAALGLDVVLTSGLEAMPSPGVKTARVTVDLDTPNQRAALFAELEGAFNIKPAPPARVLRPPQTQIMKFLTPSYRNAFAFDGPRTRFAVTDDSYKCALTETNVATQAPRPPLTDEVTWGQVVAFALKNPLLAEALGLLYRDIVVPAEGIFDTGGWLHVALTPGSAYASETAADPSLLSLYAARVPALTEPRALFAAVLFPVLAAPPGSYDDVFVEAESYDDGFAKIVHGAQPRTMGVVDLDPSDPLPVKDIGVRLGWDDEQIAIWLNRSIDPAVAEDTLLGVGGYRLDVRHAGSADWHSMVKARGPVQVGPLAVGTFDAELAVQTAPVQLQGQKSGNFWLPSYFVSWAGRSVVVRDRAAFEVSGQIAVAAPTLEPIDDDAVPLRYGRDYEFRVRLRDLSGGGPGADRDPRNPAPAPIAQVPFRRWVPPKEVAVTEEPSRLLVHRPLIGYPDLVFTGFDAPVDALLADTPRALLEQRETGVPDPDVVAVQIAVEVRTLEGDDRVRGRRGPHLRLYTTVRHFAAGAPLHAPLEVEFNFRDVKDVRELQPADPFEAQPGVGPLALPTARDVRLRLRAVGKPDPGLAYFGSEAARLAQRDVSVALRAPAADERELFVRRPAGEQIRAFFLQPEPAATSQLAAEAALQGRSGEVPPDLAQCLAQRLDLNAVGLTLSGRGRRTVFGCSSHLAHTLSSARAAITFGSKAELAQQWIVALSVQLDRDWTWDGVAPRGFEIHRANGEVAGTIELPRSVSREALDGDERGQTDLVFFDAVDGKPPAGSHPAELMRRYSIVPVFWQPTPVADPPLEWPLRLPITAPPRQTPRLVAAGIALSPYEKADDYSSTEGRRRHLWLEFEAAPDDPDDLYFARVLAYAPDPLLLHEDEEVRAPPEPGLPIDPETIRIITPGQPGDHAGLDAMQALIPATPREPGQPVRHFLLPLPPGADPASPRLFGFFVYELRVGHDASRWCTAQARFGLPLRVTGVQHPAPALVCAATRLPDYVAVSAPLATPVLDGRSLRPNHPRTDIWALLYAQVMQLDGVSKRNILIGRALAETEVAPRDQRLADYPRQHARARFDQKSILESLTALGLPAGAGLTAMAVEVYHGALESSDPLGTGLGQVRILRASNLTPVPAMCAPA